MGVVATYTLGYTLLSPLNLVIHPHNFTERGAVSCYTLHVVKGVEEGAK
ncbi:hypothetical protein ANAPC5_01373 [Anaplasma phagocytophilum]|nr:hypothetical protein ANAPC5_01373 [Anaplasma phagocytophilum]